MNITSSGMMSTYRSSDSITNTLKSTSLTSKAKQSLHEMDKQAEENSTYLYEYKALLNSKLTTLTTALTSAYTTDLDSCMGAVAGGSVSFVKSAMHGITGTLNTDGETIIDPGAARTAKAYFEKWANGSALTISTGTDTTIYGTSTTQSQSVSAGFTWNPGGTIPASLVGGKVSGTTTIINAVNTDKSTSDAGNPLTVDEMSIDFVMNNQNTTSFINTKQSQIGGDTLAGKNIGNQFELTLYNFFSKKENHDVIKFGLFDNIYVSGTSSLPTGSQVQGALSVAWDQDTGKVIITQQKFSAFFHS